MPVEPDTEGAPDARESTLILPSAQRTSSVLPCALDGAQLTTCLVGLGQPVRSFRKKNAAGDPKRTDFPNFGGHLEFPAPIEEQNIGALGPGA